MYVRSLLDVVRSLLDVCLKFARCLFKVCSMFCSKFAQCWCEALLDVLLDDWHMFV